MSALIDTQSILVAAQKAIRQNEKTIFHIIPYEGRWIHVGEDGRIAGTGHLRRSADRINLTYEEFTQYYSEVKFSELMCADEYRRVIKEWRGSKSATI